MSSSVVIVQTWKRLTGAEGCGFNAFSTEMSSFNSYVLSGFYLDIVVESLLGRVKIGFRRLVGERLGVEDSHCGPSWCASQNPLLFLTALLKGLEEWKPIRLYLSWEVSFLQTKEVACAYIIFQEYPWTAGTPLETLLQVCHCWHWPKHSEGMHWAKMKYFNWKGNALVIYIFS